MTYEMTDKLGFEIRTCTCCGGCGRYSYNQMDGDRCYGCGGSGKSYTKRGSLAKKFYEDSLSVPMSEMKVGDLMQVESMSCRYFAEVVEIGPSSSKAQINGEWVSGTEITTDHPKYGRSGLTAWSDHPVRKGWSAEDKAPKIAAALAYQDTLTKAGEPRKR